jgi:uncharacterized membrane protein YeaQ/YmgE (transglycosylase-associated protein family)
MSVLGFIVLLVIAAVCGAIGQSLVGYSLGGCVVSSVVGLVGALLGYWIASRFGLPLIFTLNIDGQQFPVIWAIIGSVLLVAIISLFSRPRRRYRRY